MDVLRLLAYLAACALAVNAGRQLREPLLDPAHVQHLGLLAYAVAAIALGHAMAPAGRLFVRLLDQWDRENDPAR